MEISDDLIQQVWERGREVEGYDGSIFRKDACGAWIVRSYYGITDSVFGWEIDHVRPQSSLAGVDDARVNDLRNLRPMQWANNRAKANDYPWYNSAYVALGDKNVKNKRLFRVNRDLYAALEKLYKEGEQ